MLDPTDKCPCCSGKLFNACCEPLLSNEQYAKTPEDLMRSRYSAHVCKNIKYIISTMRGKALKLFDEQATTDEWFEQATWEKLEIIAANDDLVEFRAHYLLNGKSQVLHELSRFEKVGGKWYYVAGQNKAAETRIHNKVGRNDPCPCGSGKKYKKCCTAVNS